MAIPTLLGASVDGVSLTLKYNVLLDDSHQPSTSFFQVLVDGLNRSVTNLRIDDYSVILTLGAPVDKTDTDITISYKDPSTSNNVYAIQSLAGEDAASLSNHAVANDTPVVSDVTKPSLVNVGFANTSNSVITLTFNEPMKLSADVNLNLLKNGVTPMSVTKTAVSDSSILITTNTLLTGADFVVMNYDGTDFRDLAGNLYPAHTLAIGGSLANTIDFSGMSTSYPLVIRSGGGNDIVTGSEGNDTLSGGGGADTLNGSYGADTIIVSELDHAADTVQVMAETEYSGSTVAHPDTVVHFDVSGTTTNDKLGLATLEISGNVLHKDGIDVGSLAKHSITGGILRFENSAGVAVTINESNLDDALMYLFRNLPTAGKTTAFGVDTDASGNNDSLYVYQPRSYQDPTEFAYYNLVKLAGVNGVTLATSAGLNKVQIVDTTAPWAVDATTTTNGLSVNFIESIASYDLSGLVLRVGNGSVLGAAKPITSTASSGSTVTVAANISVGANDYVMVSVNDPTRQHVTDVSGNTGNAVTEEVSGLAFGGEADTVIDLSALVGAYGISGRGGNDQLTGNSIENWIRGGVGNDTLRGLAGDDELLGDAGADTLDGGLGADELIGGAGNDTYIVDNAGDSVIETWSDIDLTDSGGIDLVKSSITRTLGTYQENLTLTGTAAINGTGNGSDNVLTGNGAANKLTGLAGADTLVGNGGNDTLNGGTGTDTMKGGTGNDIYVVDNIGDIVTELSGQGTDLVQSGVTYTLTTNVEKLTLTGTAAINGTGNGSNNTLTGNGAANKLTGLAGNDTLVGNGGNDTLTGGAGNDALTGGLGSDFFVFNAALNATTNIDTLKDYTTVADTIRLENAIFTKLTALGTLSAVNFKVGAAAADANDYIVYNNSTGALYYDADGSGATAAIQFATVYSSGTTPAALSATEFVVI